MLKDYLKERENTYRARKEKVTNWLLENSSGVQVEEDREFQANELLWELQERLSDYIKLQS